MIDAQETDQNDGRGAIILVPMVLAAISGFLMGLLFRGEIFGALFCVMTALFCTCLGWWARGRPN